jgi:hypothetical protein
LSYLINRKKVLLLKIYPPFITDWATQPPRTLGNVHTMAKQWKPYGHTSRTTMIPTATGFYVHFFSVVQLSGMGKSRTVDELGKELGMVRFGSVWFFNGFLRTPNQTIGSVQNGQVLVLKWFKP